MKRVKGNKRGVSPVIATVLLISMVVVLAMIVILWFTSFAKEAITKFENQNVEIVCRDKVAFDADYDSTGDVLSIVNTGSSPIWRMRIQEELAGGEYGTVELTDDWPNKGLNQGKSFSSSIGYTGSKITLIPVLLGNSDRGMQTYPCKEEEGLVLDII